MLKNEDNSVMRPDHKGAILDMVGLLHLTTDFDLARAGAFHFQDQMQSERISGWIAESESRR